MIHGVNGLVGFTEAEFTKRTRNTHPSLVDLVITSLSLTLELNAL